MNYSGYELLWLFFVYSFLGWLIETAVASGKAPEVYQPRCFYRTGLFCLRIFCRIYDAGILGTERQSVVSVPWLYDRGDSCGMVYGKSTGTDESSGNGGIIPGKQWNFDGYICLPYSLLWGILGVPSVFIMEMSFSQSFINCCLSLICRDSGMD